MRLLHNPTLDETSLSVFEGIVQLSKSSKAGRVIPLHQGKTHFTTAVPLRAWETGEFDYPPHHDGPTCGTQSLIEAVQRKLERERDQTIDPTRISITSGITHGLFIAFQCVLMPGDEVIVLSPQWLFTTGLIRAANGVPIEVPAFETRRGEPKPDLPGVIRPHLTARTRAIYFNTPNNPTGQCLTPEQLEGLAAFAREHDLWLISDNAYELYDYSRTGFIDIGTLEDAKDRTFSAYSFSKSYGMTGYRIGYLVSPPSMTERARKFGLYSIYSVPTVCQYVALAALRAGPEAIRPNVAFVREALELTTRNLKVPAVVPAGGFYTLLDLSAWPGSVDEFIACCIAQGASLAPGRAFGSQYERFARLCFSVVDHPELLTGIGIVNDVYSRGPNLS